MATVEDDTIEKIEDIVDEKEDKELDSDEEDKEIIQTARDTFLQMPMKDFCIVVAQTHFGKQYPDNSTVMKNENFTKTIKFDLKKDDNEMDKVFRGRILFMLRNVHLKEPDECFFSLYARKAGGSVSGKFSSDITLCSAVLLSDFIQIRDQDENLVLCDGYILRPCKVEKTELKLNAVNKEYISGKMNPYIEKNITIVDVKEPDRLVNIKGRRMRINGKSHRKAKLRNHLSHVLWIGWKDDPVQSQVQIDENNRIADLSKEFENMEEELKKELV